MSGRPTHVCVYRLLRDKGEEMYNHLVIVNVVGAMCGVVGILLSLLGGLWTLLGVNIILFVINFCIVVMRIEDNKEKK